MHKISYLNIQIRTKNWIEIKNQSRGVYNTNSDIKFKTTMLKSIFCDYSDAYILVKGRTRVTGAEMMTQPDKQIKEIKA